MIFLKKYLNFFDKYYKNKSILIEQIDKLEISIKDIPLVYKNDKDILIRYLQNCGNSLGDLPKNQRDDKELVLAAISAVGSSFVFASNRLKNDKEVILKALSVPFGSALRIVEEMNAKYYDDEDVMCLAIKKSNSCFRYVSKNLKYNFDFMFNRLKDYPNLYKDCEYEMRSDKKIIEMILEKEPKLLLEHIPLKSLNKDLIYNILENIYVKNGNIVLQDENLYKLKYHDILIGFEDEKDIIVSMIINKREEEIIKNSIIINNKKAKINKF